jgi:hypothetical protein
MSSPPESPAGHLQRASDALTRAATAQRAGEPIDAHVADAVRHMREAANGRGVGPETLLAAMRRAWIAADGDGRHDERFAEIVQRCMREYFRQAGDGA